MYEGVVKVVVISIRFCLTRVSIWVLQGLYILRVASASQSLVSRL